MRALTSRSVLCWSLFGCLAALVTALVVGDTSEAEKRAAGPATRAAVAAQRGGGTAALGHRVSPFSGRDVPALRTETSRTYRRGDGTFTAVVSPTPVNVADGKGSWNPIDTTLRADGKGVLRTTASPAAVTLPRDLAGAARVADGDRWVAFRLLDGAGRASVASARGATATYRGAAPGVDAAYTAQAHGLKETLTLTDAKAPAAYRYALDASDGLRATLRRDGTVVLRDADGAMRFWLPAPTVQEQGGTETTRHVRYRLSADRRTLTVAVDRAWLSGARFPVIVDPTVYQGADSSCTISSGSPALPADCNGTSLKVGNDSSRVYRSVLRFTNLNAEVPRTASIIGSRLNLTFPSQSATNATTRIDAYGLTKTLGASATWTTYSGSSTWTTPGGDFSTTAPQSNPTWLVQSYTGGWVSWDISALAEKWVRNPADDNGVILKAANESAGNVVTLGGQSYAAGGPTLEITYEMHPGFERDQQRETIGLDDRSAASVGLSSGNLAIDSTDINLPGVAGLNLQVNRTYNAQNLGDGSTLFGTAWTESINGAETITGYNWLDDQRIIYANGNAIYRFDRDYASDTSGKMAYTTPPGIDADLSVDTSTDVSTLTFRKTGTKWIYLAPHDDSNMRLSQIVDRNGNHIDLAYRTDHQSKLDHITDTYGRQLTFHYNSANWQVLDSITDASGREWSYGHDTTTSPGHPILTSFTNPDGKTTSYHYFTPAEVDGTTWDKMKSMTDARGHDVTFEYGPDGDWSQVTKITRPVDANTAHDIVWQYKYHPASGTGATCTTTGGLAPVGRTVETDPEGHLTTYCYNQSGQTIETFDANGRSVRTEYNAQANVAKFTGLAGTANPSLTTYSFQSANSSNPTGSSTPVGSNAQTTSIKYCGTAAGDTGTACSGTYAQDKYLPMTFTDTQGTQTGFGYDSKGNLTDVNTTSGSDTGHLTYDATGNVLTSRDGNMNVTTYTWTSNFLTEVAPPTPLAHQLFGPDSLSRVKWAKDGNGVWACATYDKEDRVTRVDWKTGLTSNDCATGTTSKWMTFTYDNNGNVTQRADNAGNTTTYGYDYANRRTSESFPSSRTNTYGYDRASNLTSLTDNDGTVSYTYDPANRLQTIVSPKPTSGTSTITYSYTDPAAATDPSKQTATFPGGLKQETTTDAAGDITSVKVLNGSTVLDKRDYTYLHTVGSTTSVSALIQTMTDNAGNVTSYTPGAANRLLDAVTLNGTTPVEEWHYTYDAAGNRTVRRHKVGAGSMVNTSYGYNAANQLCYSVAGTPAGSCSGSPGVPAGATTYSYDTAGQRTTSPSAAYDAIQRLATLGGTSLSYLSPGNGELVGYGTSSFQNTQLGLGRIIPPSGSATDLIRATNGAALAQRVGTTSKQSLFTDALGSVIATADDGATALGKRYTYDPDGNATSSGSGTDSVVRYAGGYAVGGLYHFGARFYDPSTAVWTQLDPLNQIGSLTEANRYTYVGGNPINGVDPTGELIDTLLDKAGDYLHAGERFIFSDKLRRRARVGTALKFAARGFVAYDVADYANSCANKLTGGGLEGHNNGSCNPVSVLNPLSLP